MTTIRDIAKLAGVSSATVSYVINNTRPVSERRRERVLKAIQDLNFVPNAVARGLRVRASRTIGLVVSDVTNPFFPDLAKSCEEVVGPSGYAMVVTNTNECEEQMATALRPLREGKVDGVIVASARFGDRPAVAQLLDSKLPVVLVHRRIPDLPVDAVVADNYGGAYASARHLIGLGHRRIAVITGVMESSVGVDRIRALRDALTRAELPLDPDLVRPGESQYGASYSAAQHLLTLPSARRPTAIVAGNDVAALAALDAAQDLGFSVPRDLAVVGFDDIFVSSSRCVGLTTVRIPRYQMGHVAAKLLLDRIAGGGPDEPALITIPTELVVRRTCGANLSGS